eukprot:sb/3474886/
MRVVGSGDQSAVTRLAAPLRCRARVPGADCCKQGHRATHSLGNEANAIPMNVKKCLSCTVLTPTNHNSLFRSRYWFIRQSGASISWFGRFPFTSGDIEILSTLFKGVQMVPVLNALNISAAVYGNHDFGPPN